MRTRPPALVDASGTPVALGAEIGRGGEGAVFDVTGQPDLVAKVYHHAAPPERARKLRTMAAAGGTTLAKVAAWPTSTMHPAAAGPSGPVLGLLMPKVTGHLEVHRLYSPTQRRTDFPRADWRFLVRAARNVAAAVASIHEAGHVIGDVNQNNVVVSAGATARLIDCDSFQVRDGQGWHLCEVGVAHFTPPELQGGSFRSVVRTPQHDAFGLAVLVFHLLFMGRHPFVGVYSGRDMQIEEAIREFRFAFGSQASRIGLRPPPASLPLAAASVRVAEMFERAFSATALRNGGRPTADEWVHALQTLGEETTACAAFQGHTYHKSLPACPWCAIEAAGGPNFFVTALVVTPGAAFDLAAVWAEILAVAPPPDSLRATPAAGTPAAPTASPAPVVGTPIPRKVRVIAAGARLSGFAALASIAGALLQWQLPSPEIWVAATVLLWLALRSSNSLPAENRRREESAAAAKRAWQTANERAARELQEARRRFDERRQQLNALRTEHLNLPDAKRHALAQLERDRRATQLRHFLERQEIQRAKIEGIGPGRAATLLSFGIESAADVTRQAVLRVPGFGPGLTNRLLAWRHACEARFRFDPSKGIDPNDVQRIEQQFVRRRQEIEVALRGGAHELRRLRTQGDQRHASLAPELERLSVEMHRANADLALV